MEFKELSVFEFSAIVPPFEEMKANRVLQIYSSPDGQQQLYGLTMLMREQLPPDKVAEFDELPINAVYSLLMQWVNSRAS